MERAENRLIKCWSVWRQDDNGNRFLVKENISKAEAQRLVSGYETKGHKQTYWLENNFSKINT